MAIRTRSTSRFQALKLTTMVACAFNPTTGKIHWQSRPGKEQFGDVVGRDIRDIWPDPQMVAGPVDRIGPTPAGMVRAIGWNLRLDRDAMLSVLERVEVVGVLPPNARGARSWFEVVSVEADEGVKLAALRALIELAADRRPRTLTLGGKDTRLAQMLREGRSPAEICDGLDVSVDTLIASLWRLAG